MLTIPIGIFLNTAPGATESFLSTLLYAAFDSARVIFIEFDAASTVVWTMREKKCA